MLDVVVNNSIDLEGFGACEGTLTCSTCHLILKQEDFDRLPGKLLYSVMIINFHTMQINFFCFILEKPGDEELDMLDLAYELTDTSRLGCQIILSKELNGLEVQVPTTINDARSWANWFCSNNAIIQYWINHQTKISLIYTETDEIHEYLTRNKV